MNLNNLPIFSVSQVNQHIKRFMDADELLANLLIRGEISNYKYHNPSGHHYFSLKDRDGTLSCVMYRGDAVRLRFRPSNGMKVIAFGRVSVFPRDGKYQLYCRDMMAEGAGDLNAAFERLKEALRAEGLFDGEKKPIPPMPGRIALVTSPTGAAVQDMLRILEARWPMTHVVIVPVRVQGEGAAAEIAAAIGRVNRERLADLIITGRGGGSMEDLWAFNEEIVARAIYASRIPVISAVGHEPDVTIADYVADLRAATPSNAAELAVPDQNEVYERLARLSGRMRRAQLVRLQNARRRLDYLGSRRVIKDMRAPIEDRRMLLDHQQQRLVLAFRQALAGRQREAARLSAALDALSPLKVLGRGYAIAYSGERVLSSVKDIRPGERLKLRMVDGGLECTVTKKERISNGRKKADL